MGGSGLVRPDPVEVICRIRTETADSLYTLDHRGTELEFLAVS